ncbi:MAG: hypothetical protein M3R17_11500 [Bacteroidota bacterium]|nr:hypothetical protein [Bacteroidota bacterium]
MVIKKNAIKNRTNEVQESLLKAIETRKNVTVIKMNWKIIKKITKDGEIILNKPCEVYLVNENKDKQKFSNF